MKTRILGATLFLMLLSAVSPAWSTQITYQDWSRRSEDWRRGFVTSLAGNLSTIIRSAKEPHPSMAYAYRRCLARFTDAFLVQQIENYVARNPRSLTEPMIVVSIRVFHSICGLR